MTQRTHCMVKEVSQRGATGELKVARAAVPAFLREANTLAQSGRMEEACALLKSDRLSQLMQLGDQDPTLADVLDLIVGSIYAKADRAQDAIHWLKRAATRTPSVLVLNELAGVLQSIGHFTEALSHREQALALEPHNAALQGATAATLIKLGRVTEGIAGLKALIESGVDCCQDHSALLWYLHYLPDQDRQAVKEAHRSWGTRYAPATLTRHTHDRDRRVDRRLRVGYVSADFRRHSVAYNFEPFLAGRDSEATEVYGYANVARPDDMTQRLRARFDHYRSIYGVEDSEAAAQIERDKIDVLVHLGGHTAGHRLGVLAYKPAPVQVDYGGIDTCGMSQVDYRLTDTLLDPAEAQADYLEQLAYLPGGLVCFTPPQGAPPVGPLPLGQKGHVTFGSFNHHNKINDRVLALWARILQQSQEGHLVIKNLGCTDPAVRAQYRRYFNRRGIADDRIHLYGLLSDHDHLDLYNQIDIALDTFPFNGCITTLEALWMGVPVVSLCQERYVSRVGLTLLKRLGLEFFVSADAHSYAAKVYALSKKEEALAALRAGMRDRMRGSPVCDAKRLAREAEASYRRMWHEWCSVKG